MGRVILPLSPSPLFMLIPLTAKLNSQTHACQSVWTNKFTLVNLHSPTTSCPTLHAQIQVHQSSHALPCMHKLKHVNTICLHMSQYICLIDLMRSGVAKGTIYTRIVFSTE